MREFWRDFVEAPEFPSAVFLALGSATAWTVVVLL